MESNPINIRKSINKAFLKVKPDRSQIESFKINLKYLLDQIKESESEEFHKNIISDYLKNTYYGQNHYINTKGRTDLVIHNGKDSKSSVGVLMEAKNPSNKTEMPTQENLNSKAFQELVLYYLRERISDGNLEIKHLIATNNYEWYIFDSNEFEKLFAKNKKLVKQFTDFEEGRLSGKTTDFFYKDIISPFVEHSEFQISYTYFNLRDYSTVLTSDVNTSLIPLFKIFSPEHLLKLPFINDSNTLDRSFYNELLHIIGLEEVKDKSKKIIRRKIGENRDAGSLIENAITILNYEDCLSQIPNLRDYGEAKDEQLYNVALELVITWINRILFIKLLEGQLLRYHNGDPNFKFLDFKTIPNYDELNKLFFHVLAVKEDERNEIVEKKYSNIPYLNSSLFEPNDLEHKTIRISNLEDDYEIPILSNTVLKDNTGKRIKGERRTLQYFFEFLDAYDFSSEGSEGIQEENKTLINASVLGLIFEKINGYKDGSFFTPGFITMYMCRETIRRAVVQKFNEVKGIKYESLNDLYNHIEDKKEANEIINSLKICDPAVGSGHFLVSALNEIIAIKSELKILSDSKGRVLRDYHIEVVNDELVITDEDGEFYEYHPKNPESQRIQETLFHEKQTIMENCLFGVDINQNSVKICRLRLWIELLKNTYYKPDSGFTQLETLPNIDINIKCGNSLISRYPLDADIKKALAKSKWTIDSYRLAVMTYRNAENREQKGEMRRLINEIKSDFESEVARNDKRFLRLNKLKGDLSNLTDQNSLFELSQKEKSEWEKRVKKITDELNKIETELEEIKNNEIYEHAFEWRFEFPEVLNDDGDFVGFDVIIGNPPYIRQEGFKEFKSLLKSRFITFTSTADLYVYFVEHGINILVPNGNFVFIIPNKWMKAGYGKDLRQFIKKLKINSILDFGDLPVFEEASTYPCIISLSKVEQGSFLDAANIKSLNFPEDLKAYVSKNSIKVSVKELHDNGWILSDPKVHKIIEKIRNSGIPLREYVNDKIFYGIKTGLNEAFVIDEATRNELIKADYKSKEIIKHYISGRDIKRYKNPRSTKYLILFENRQTKQWFGDLDEDSAWKKLNKKYVAICEHLSQFKERAQSRFDQGNYWWELRACEYYDEIEKQKIAWPETSFDNQFCYVEKGIYLNKTAFFIPVVDHYLLALLNSKLAKFYYGSIVSKMRGGYFSMSKAYVETFRIIQDENRVLEIKSIVDQLLNLEKHSSNFDTNNLEKQIDQMVYDLYGLSEEEIKIIEESVS